MPTTRRAGVMKTRAHPPETSDEPDESGPRGRAPERPRRPLNAATAGGIALRHITELTSRQSEGVTSVEPTEDGWLVSVEVVESRRIPSSSDMLAIYLLTIDKEGRLVSYRRTRRYRRANADFSEAY
ncbi:Gas vesicle synthesis protein GvpO [Nonomuraea maritima]|uniref:Gas vesicle synthesis protein GvpO n=1 Tax=Nonomuraea maritima TaxID=683260 RepID=A0A1G9A893_9ACTN|nr:gas vesicle protein GvpO [Nonomuraea maritima]SDK23559.1 Gas vesicle synthesis protein GvpO [Nonomuraea maritima]